MFVGFDYGSANCALGVMTDNGVRLLPLAGDSRHISSTLYAYDRELIAEAVYQRLHSDRQVAYAQKRSAELSPAKLVRRELDLLPSDEVVFFGEAAFKAYVEVPEEGFYVRSPKSFLGATGLRVDQISLFEDIVTLMMMHIKQQGELALGQIINRAVIGRPVNFQGIGGEQANKQAEHAKIALSDTDSTQANLEFVETQLYPVVSAAQLVSAIDEPLSRVDALMRSAVDTAGVQPDTVYVTGGTARSPAIYQRIARCFPECEIVVGDHFGSVTAGLTRWAQKLFSY